MLFRSYLRNKPTNTNNATNPANPDSPNVFMIDVRLPITFTPKTPLPKRTSEIAPIATKDINRWAKSSIHPFTIVTTSFISLLPLVKQKRGFHPYINNYNIYFIFKIYIYRVFFITTDIYNWVIVSNIGVKNGKWIWNFWR